MDEKEINYYLIERNHSKNSLAVNVDFCFMFSRGLNALEKTLRKQGYELFVIELEKGKKEIFNITNGFLTPGEIEIIRHANYKINPLSKETYLKYTSKNTEKGIKDAEIYLHIKEQSLDICL